MSDRKTGSTPPAIAGEWFYCTFCGGRLAAPGDAFPVKRYAITLYLILIAPYVVAMCFGGALWVGIRMGSNPDRTRTREFIKWQERERKREHAKQS